MTKITLDFFATVADTKPMKNDPRGPLRTIISVERTPQANLVRYAECKHIGEKVPHQSVNVGDQSRCSECS